MKRRRKQRDNFVQSLFPFLAVLLSTMGALVLLLMLIVNQAQASAKQMAAEKKTQIEDAESNLELVRNSFEEQLDDRRLELERKRLTLQHLEKHIKELIEEVKGIERTAVLLGQKQSQDKTVEAETERQISQLEKQLTDANIDLKKKLDKPEGNKPIFAIIPYQGTNGTHRRPIYLECTSQGVTIQPEGVLIGLADLRPPFGPGNPLDAAIRTVRSHFVPANGALTSTAYPLLVVRPSGVRSYAMARQAMAGWDDQFGYELIDEALELTYPDSEPGIVAEIDQALVLARERQAALMMAMPAKYRQYINQGGAMESLEFGDDASDMGDEWAGGSSGSTNGSGAPNSDSSSGHRGGFAASQGGTTGQRGTGGGSGTGQRNGAPGRQGTQQPGTQQSGSQQMGFGGSANNTAEAGGTSFFANGSGQPAGEGTYFGSGSNGSQEIGGKQANGDFAGRNAGGGNGEFADTSSRTNGGQGGTGAGGTGTDGNSDTSVTGNAGSGSGGSGSGGSGNGGSGNDGSGNGAPRSGSATGPSAGAVRMADGNGPASGGAGGGAASTGGSPQSGASQDPTANPGNPSDPAQAGSPSFNMDMSRNNAQGKRDSQSEPVAQQRGRNWAWREGPPTKTPVVRSIRVVCYNDRWVLMQDNVSTSNQVTVPIGKSPQASAEKLAKAITDRVSGWGIALGGGYWKPELVVDVAPGAEARYGQLERLLEGSGLKVQRRANVK